MDIITLKVFNSLYNLNITEPEFEDIERELKDKDKTGIYIAAIKDGKSICVSHDEQKHRIVIEKIQNQKIRIMPKSRILFKTLITFKNIPEEIFTLHRIAQYKARDNEIKFTAHNLEAIKNRICNRFADGYPKELGGVYDDVFSSANNRKNAKKKKPVLVVKQLAALFWLFDEKYVEHDYPSRLNIARIIKVWQRKNMRIALFQENECWTINRSGLCYNYEDVDRVTYRIKTYTPKDSRFNYVCPNREIGLTQNSDYIELWLDDDLFEKVSPPELEIIQKIIRNENKTGEWKLLNADKFNNLRRQIRTEGRLTRRSKELKEAEQTLKKNIKKQFNNGKVVRLGITFAKNFFSYEGIIIKGDDMDSYIVKNNIMLLERPDFNNIFFGYIEHLLDIRTVHNYYPYSREIYFMRGEKCFNAGKIKVKVITGT